MKLASDSVPQANDPTRIVLLCRHWVRWGVGRWPDAFSNQRDRSYYRQALQVLGALDAEGDATPRMRALASSEATASQRAFRDGLTESAVFARWMRWSTVDRLEDLDPSTADRFLQENTDLAPSTTIRRASTLRQWLGWAIQQLAPDFQHALASALASVDLRSRSAHKFDVAKGVVARQLCMATGRLSMKTLSDRKNYGNRISEATRVAPEAVILVGAAPIDLEAISRDYRTRALSQPPTLLVEQQDGDWCARAVLHGDDRIIDPFPRDLDRIAATRAAHVASGTPEDISEAIELLLGLQEQPHSVIDTIEGELPPRLRGLCHTKRISSARQAHNRVAEALGKGPPVLVLIGHVHLQEPIERAVAQCTDLGHNEAKVLLALHDDTHFGLKESRHTGTERMTAPKPGSKPAGSIRRLAPLDWRRASYLAWNERLLDYVFASDELTDPVTRIAANPEELKRVVGDGAADPDELAGAFELTFCREVPRGRTLDTQMSHPRPIPTDEVPHFFGLLWMTCLICWGYPRKNDGSFDARLREVLGRGTQYHHLEVAWVDLAEWLEKAPGYRRLILPEPDAHRTRIGRSYFLTFPHGSDRIKLSEVLDDASLSGRQLPVPPALQALVENRRRFTTDFQRDLEEFRKIWLAGADPSSSAFWRAVQQESVCPSHQVGDVPPTASLFAREVEDLLQLYLAWPRDVDTPPGMEVELDADLDDIDSDLLVDASGDPAETAARLVVRGRLLDGPTRAAFAQGVLLLVEVDDWEYRLVFGDASEAIAALVREDRVDAFRRAFGGELQPSGLEGWQAILQPTVTSSFEPPPGLEDVDQLCISTRPPRPTLIGGIRVAGGHLWATSHQPAVRAVGAMSVEAEVDGTSMECTRSDDTWQLPPELVNASELPSDLVIRARWEVTAPDRVALVRTGTVQTRLWPWVAGWTFKPPPSGHYWVEGGTPPMRSVVGGAPIETRLGTRDPTEAADLIAFDASKRYLGPGCGELSSSSRDPSFDWMAIGPTRNPSWVIFVGNPEHPVPRDNGYSKVSRDRTRWRVCFRSADRARVRTEDGYEPLELHPLVAAEFDSRAASIKQTTPPTTRRPVATDPVLRAMEAQRGSPRSRATPSRLWQAIDVVAAISQRRRGLAGKELQRILLDLIRTDDFLLANQVRRSWEETGVIDVLHRQDRGQIVVVARRPRFLMVRDGPRILAILHGLVPRMLHDRLEATATSADLEFDIRPRVNGAWTPPVPTVWADSPAILRTLSERLDISAPLWMSWSTPGPPEHLHFAEVDPLRHDPPPEYRTEARWDWTRGWFRHDGGHDGEVTVERRRHPLRPAVFVVRSGETTHGWTRSRNWALLEASRLRQRHPFRLDEHGTVASTGASPVHLPLPLARTCAILGDTCPGPTGDRSSTEYHYPFGTRLWASLRPMLPDHWTNPERH
jgi:hypothetical protein